MNFLENVKSRLSGRNWTLKKIKILFLKHELKKRYFFDIITIKIVHNSIALIKKVL